jgi:hypothetical protein
MMDDFATAGTARLMLTLQICSALRYSRADRARTTARRKRKRDVAGAFRIRAEAITPGAIEEFQKCRS